MQLLIWTILFMITVLLGIGVALYFRFLFSGAQRKQSDEE